MNWVLGRSSHLVSALSIYKPYNSYNPIYEWEYSINLIGSIHPFTEWGPHPKYGSFGTQVPWFSQQNGLGFMDVGSSPRKNMVVSRFRSIPISPNWIKGGTIKKNMADKSAQNNAS